eukprot:gene2709-3364_t
MPSPLHVYVLGAPWGICSDAPFSLKLLTWLRMNKTRGLPSMDAHLTPVQVAQSRAWRLMLEEHFHQPGDPDRPTLCLCCAIAASPNPTIGPPQPFEHALFISSYGGARRLKEYMSHPPAPPKLVRGLAARGMRKSLTKQLHARGVGRHDEDTIVSKGKADLDAVEAHLGTTGPYALGEKPCSLDAVFMGFMAVMLYIPPYGHPLFEYARGCKSICGYVERMRAEFFPDHPAPAHYLTNSSGPPPGSSSPAGNK